MNNNMKSTLAAIAITLALLLMLLDCNTAQQVGYPAQQSNPTIAVQPETPTVTTPKSNWRVQDSEINPIDGARDQILVLEANESSRYSRNRIDLVLCFHNGKLYTGQHVGARLDVDGFVTSDSGAVRLKFDDEKPIRENWSASDSHEALFPYGRESHFLVQLLHHKRLAMEFSYYEKASQTVTFDLTGLADDMKAAGLHDPTIEVKAAGARASSANAAAEKREAACKDDYARDPFAKSSNCEYQ